MPTLTISDANDLPEVVRQHRGLVLRGAGSKTALSSLTQPEQVLLDLSAVRGILAYDPSEFTFTARAATPIAEIQVLLAEHGQYLPFDPPWPQQATLGGTVAAGLSGPGRYRYGGLRDFILSVRYVDGIGRMVRGGAGVVKNAAGFDLPKLMVGSLGRLGILTELTFKVFPQPRHFATLHAPHANLITALQTLTRLTHSPFDIEALELDADGSLWVRLGGLAAALPNRMQQLQQFVGAGQLIADDATLWAERAALTFAPLGATLVKVPITPGQIPSLDRALAAADCQRRYSMAGNLAWVVWQSALTDLDSTLQRLGLGGLVLQGAPNAFPLLGRTPNPTFIQLVAKALDPDGRFLPLLPLQPSGELAHAS